MRIISFGLLAILFMATQCLAQTMRTGPQDGWQYRFRNEANAIRILEVMPTQWTKPKRRLIVFATPNGNTLEQSYGARSQEGRDWHFDIQHIGAQLKYAQRHSADADLTLVVLQSGQLSWPAFRQATDGADRQIRRLIEALQVEHRADETYLTCHSGGGSLIWGWMNAHDQLPKNVTRIAMLDANYSYADSLQHGDKLLQWLRANDQARLFIMAYDDRRVEYQGRRVVSDDGGTYRASERMTERFEKEEKSSRDTLADMQSITFMNERILILLHPNPQNVILHTALVGERNGLAFASLWDHSPKATELVAGPRCYSEWIPADPLQDPNRGTARRASGAPSQSLNLPPRAPDAEVGSAFIQRIANLDRDAREQATLAAIQAGNVPQWSRQLIPIDIASPTGSDQATARLHVLQDYLAIGADDDAVRMPMTLATASQLCKQLNCSLPTAKLCDEIFAAADLRLNPQPMQQARDQVLTFLEHNQLIEKQLKDKPRSGIVVGHKKDVILSNALLKKAHRVAIYGWHFPSGVPIQPLYAGHVDWYTDYSHGIRLISNRVSVGDEELDYRDMLQSTPLYKWLSNEGPISDKN